jgi:hypothetical protein
LSVLLFCLFCPPCFAQNTLQLTTLLPELTELNYDNSEIADWLPAPESLYDSIHKPLFSLDSRHNWKPGERQLTSRLLLSAQSKTAASSYSLSSVFYQKLMRTASPFNRGQVSLLISSEGMVRHIALGNYRLQVGEGLCLGAYGVSQQPGNSFIIPAQGLSHPSLNGFALQLQQQRLSTVLWLSGTSRTASLEDGGITHLYESSLTSTGNKETVQEKTGGVIAAWQWPKLRLGAVYYHQSYDHSFTDTALASLQDLGGLFLNYTDTPVSLGLETNLAQHKLAQAFRLEYQLKGFYQSIRYFNRPECNPLPYDKTLQVFGQATGSRELSWDFSYKPMIRMTLSGRMAAFQDLTNATDTRWKERLIFAANWRERYWQSGITWYRFKKDAVAQFDSSSTGLLPTQNRFRAHWQQKLAAGLDYRLTGQYQHYLDQRVSRNGFSLQYALQYQFGKSELNLTFLTWSNQKSTYQPSESPSDEELLLQSDSDSAFRLRAGHRFNSRYSLSLSAYRPNRQVARQYYNLNLQADL